MTTPANILAAIVRFIRGSRAVSDCSELPLPLMMRQVAGISPPRPPLVVTCGKCGVMYFARVEGAAVVENGLCWQCATGAPRQAVPTAAEVAATRLAEVDASNTHRKVTNLNERRAKRLKGETR